MPASGSELIYLGVPTPAACFLLPLGVIIYTMLVLPYLWGAAKPYRLTLYQVRRYQGDFLDSKRNLTILLHHALQNTNSS
jgi:hypothetical protein